MSKKVFCVMLVMNSQTSKKKVLKMYLFGSVSLIFLVHIMCFLFTAIKFQLMLDLSNLVRATITAKSVVVL